MDYIHSNNSTSFLEVDIPNFQSKLYVLNFSGTEALSKLFSYEITIFPEDSQEFNDLMLGQSLSLCIHHECAASQWFNGVITELCCVGLEDGTLQPGKITLSPRLALLQHNRHSRNFEDKNVLEIIDSILQAHSISPIDISQLDFNFPSLPYCVQYQESDFAFISRLLSEYGIYYYFEHEQGSHKLVLSQNYLPGLICPENILHQNHREGNNSPHLHQWKQRTASFEPMRKSVSFSPLSPSCPSQAEQEPNQGQVALPLTLSGKSCCHFNHDEGGYHPNDNSSDIASRLTIAGHENSLKNKSIYSAGNYPNMNAGMQLNINSSVDPLINGRYYTTEVHHFAENSIQVTQNKVGEVLADSYQNRFTLKPCTLQYIPTQDFQKPQLPGVIPAIVVGPDEKERDEIYSNQNAEIKVQPLWDLSLDKNSSNTSCWVRVSQELAGDKFGMQFIPRVGQQVLLHFNQGHHHKPIVIGAILSNDESSLFKAQAQSGFQTHTLRGKPNEGHRLRMDDTPGKEQLYVKSQRDKTTLVKGNRVRQINNNCMHQIKSGAYQIEVDGDYIISANGELRLHVGSSELVLNSSGIQINADVIHVQKS